MNRCLISAVAVLAVAWIAFARGQARQAERQGVRREISDEQRATIRERPQNMSTREREAFGTQVRERLGSVNYESDREAALKDLEDQIAAQKAEQEEYFGRLREIRESALKDKAGQTAKQLDELITEWRRAFRYWQVQLEQRISAFRQAAPNREPTTSRSAGSRVREQVRPERPGPNYRRDWRIALGKNTVEAYEEFLHWYPQGALAERARERVRELSEPQNWNLARSEDTIGAYEDFLRKHPKSEQAEQARERWWELRAPRDWNLARAEDTIEAYEDFLLEHPKSEQAKDARSRLEALRADLSDWEKALKTNTIEGYAHFLKVHPSSPFADKAKGKIVDIEVSDILGSEHGQLPRARRISGEIGRTYSVVNIHNDTKYNLTIRYSGPESFKVVFDPDEKGSIELLRGDYRVAASVQAPNVRSYGGKQTSDGGNYEVEYYIKSQFAAPRFSPLRFGSAPKFEPFPSKRKVPDHLK